MATGDDLVSLAGPHVGERYVFGANVPKNNSAWRGPWDCAEFISWLVFQSAGILYGCASDDGNPATADAFTGYWARDADRMGQKVTVAQAARTPGAAILRLAVPHGLGGHIVLSDGTGKTIEAHSSEDGVIRGSLSNRRWDYGILVPGISYTSAQAAAALKPLSAPVFRQTASRSASPIVKRIQDALIRKGYSPGGNSGVFDALTTAAVQSFQVDKGLLPDGEVGPKTAKALRVSLI